MAETYPNLCQFGDSASELERLFEQQADEAAKIKSSLMVKPFHFGGSTSNYAAVP